MTTEEKIIIGKIEKISPSLKPNGPKGFIEIKGQKFNAWNNETLLKFIEGDDVTITYTTTVKPYGGQTYTNHNITEIRYSHVGKSKDVVMSEEQKKPLVNVADQKTIDKIPAPNVLIKSVDGIITLCGLRYRVKNLELELLTL
jgi:hypothetical protein